MSNLEMFLALLSMTFFLTTVVVSRANSRHVAMYEELLEIIELLGEADEAGRQIQKRQRQA